MKLINKLTGLLLLGLVIFSCDTNDEVTNYEEATPFYELPTAFTLTEDTSAQTDNSFDVVYTPTKEGKAYYIVVDGGATAPTSTQVHNASVSGIYQSGSFAVDGTTPITITVDSDIYGGYDYDVYAIHKSTDDFISEEVTKLSTTTIDTMDPVFIREESSPAFESAGIDPFGEVYFKFSEPVFYQGGTITFTGYDSGRVVEVSDAASLMKTGLYQGVIDHGTFPEDDYVIVNWEEGVFADKSGKLVAELGGFNHYFSTREFTLQEKAFLMQGTYTYETVFWGGSLENIYYGYQSILLPETGEYEVVLDPEDENGLTLLSINLYSPFKDDPDFGPIFPNVPEALKMTIDEENYDFWTGFYNLATPENIDSGMEAFTSDGSLLHWGPYSETSPGLWDFDYENGFLYPWYTLYFTADDYAVDDIDYIYYRVGTYDKVASKIEKAKKIVAAKKAELKAQREYREINNTLK